MMLSSTRSWFCGFVTLLFVAPFSGARAATVIPQSTTSLTRQATHVVRGIVREQREGYDERARHSIIETTLAVDEVLKGETSRTIVIRQLKGIPGDARFQNGEEVVLFLRAGTGPHQGAYFLLGMGQGKFEVRRLTGAPVVVERDFSELSFVSNDGSPGKAPTERAMKLTELKSRIREAAAVHP